MQLHRICSAIIAGAMLVLSGCGGSESSSPSVDAKAIPRVKAQATDYNNVVEQLYIAYFGRPADPGGLVNFDNALLAADAPTEIGSFSAAYSTNSQVKALVNSFSTSTESQNLYGSSTTTQFVTAIFSNVIGRQPAQSGLTFWVNAIDSGSLTKANAALSIMAGGLTNNSAQGAIDTQLINNRLTVASYFTSQLTALGDTYSYSGAAAAASARTMLAGITSTSDMTAYPQTVASVIASLVANHVSTVTTFAGGATCTTAVCDGTGTGASFLAPSGMAIDAAGNVYVADSYFIRKISPAGVVTTLAGGGKTCNYSANPNCFTGTGTDVLFGGGGFSYFGIAADAAGNVYVGDGNKLIRKVTPAGVTTILAGGGGCSLGKVSCSIDGTGSAASFNEPLGLVVDASGNVYVADSFDKLIRKITPAGVVTTFAGGTTCQGVGAGQGSVACSVDGTGTAAGFLLPKAITIDSSGNLFVADGASVRKVTPAGVVTTVAGNQKCILGVATCTIAGSTSYETLTAIAVDASDNVYVVEPNLTDATLNLIRKVTPDGVVTTWAGGGDCRPGQTACSINGPANTASFNFNFLAGGMAVDAGGNLYVPDNTNLIRKISR